MACPLCSPENEKVLWRNQHLRVIAVDDVDNAPAFCRVVWNQHIAEMTDLTPDERQILMNTVFCLERAMRQVLRPSKINLASLGNVVAHLHWHVIARFEHDAFFPQTVWHSAIRPANLQLPADWQQHIKQLLIQECS